MSTGLVVLIVVALVALVIGRATVSRRKSFGLQEAERAGTYVERTVEALDPVIGSQPNARGAVAKATASAMLGMAMSLGYENTIESELEGLRNATESANDRLNRKADKVGSKVQRLRARIAAFEGVVRSNVARVRHAEGVAKIFGDE